MEEGTTVNCYDLAVEREATRIAKWCLAFWRMVISEADHVVQDSRNGSKITGLHPNFLLQQNCQARPFPASTCCLGPDIFLPGQLPPTVQPLPPGEVGFHEFGSTGESIPWLSLT